jgi:hypothetical protein
MAFKDFITSGTYSIINRVQYDSQTKDLSYVITVFTDASKEERMATMEKMHNCDYEYLSIIDKEVNTPPPTDSLSIGDSYIIGPSPTGDWKPHPGLLVKWAKRWEYGYDIPDIFYDKKDKKYYKKRGDKYIEVKDVFTKETWNKYFSIEALNKKDNNLIKAIYSYLKTRTEISGVTDC